MRPIMQRAGPFAAVYLLLAAGGARAEAPVDGDRLALQGGGEVGPAGAEVRATWSRIRALPGEGILWRERDARAGLTLAATPASASAGARASVVPIAFLELGVAYEATGYFGAFGSLWRAPSRRAAFGDAVLRDARGRPGMIHRLTFTPTLRARLGPVLLLDQTDLTLVALSRGRGWYRVPDKDTLVASRDAILSNQLAALVQAWRGRGEAGLLVGPSAELVRAVRADLTRLRLGGVGLLTLGDRLGPLARPRLFAWAGVAARDRNRRGEPFAVVGVLADLDLAPPAAAGAPPLTPAASPP